MLIFVFTLFSPAVKSQENSNTFNQCDFGSYILDVDGNCIDLTNIENLNNNNNNIINNDAVNNPPETQTQLSLNDLPSIFLTNYGTNFCYVISLPEITIFISHQGRFRYKLENEYNAYLFDYYKVGKDKGRLKKVYEYTITYHDHGSIKSINKINFFYYTTSRGNYIKKMGDIPIEYKNMGTNNLRITKIKDVDFSYQNLKFLEINKDYIDNNIPIQMNPQANDCGENEDK